MSALVSYLQALATPAIAIAGAAIAFGQYCVSRMNLRHALYDRRAKVYAAPQRLLVTFQQSGGVSRDELYAFLQGSAEATFLFKPAIVKYLQEMREKAAKKIYLETKLQSGNFTLDERTRFANQEAALSNWFNDQFDVLREKFKASMDLQ